MDPISDVAPYSWIDDSALEVAACVTAVPAKTVGAVLSAFGADAGQPTSVDSLVSAGSMHVCVIEVPGGAIAVELNGYRGADSGVLALLSDAGTVASMFWNVNDDNAFTCARDGRIVARVDMYDAEDPDEVDLPVDLQQLFRLAADEEAQLHAIGLSMVERFTGLRLTADDLAQMVVGYPLIGT